MTENILAKELCGLLQKGLSGIGSSTPDGTRMKSPSVINGFLPPKRDAKDDFPFVAVIPVKGSTDDLGTYTDVRIEIGAWSEDFDGYGYAMNVMSRIRDILVTLPDRTLAGMFRLAMPFSWEMEAEQPYPGWLMTVTTSWETYSPEVRLSNEEDVYGYFQR